MTSQHAKQSLSDILIDSDASFPPPKTPKLVRRPSNSFDDHPFVWLNKWIMYFPMWTSTTIQNNKTVPRNKHAGKLGYYAVISLTIIFFIWDTFWWLYLPGVSLFSLVAVLSVLLTNIARGICIYYFFHHFQYYGLPHLRKSHDVQSKQDTQKRDVLDVHIELEIPARLKASVSSLTHDQHMRLMNKTNLRFKIILVWITLASIINAIISAVQTSRTLPHDNPVVKSIMIGQAIFNFIYIYFYQIPLFLAQFVLSIYYVRACIFVKEFIEMIDIDHVVDFNAAIQEYATYRTMFRNKIVWVERIMVLQLASKVSWIWVDVNWLMEAPHWYDVFIPFLWLSIAVLPFLEMVFSANAATNKFHALRKKLYRIGTEKNYFGELTAEQAMDRTRYLFLLDYVSTYPFMIRILAREISFKNAAKVSVAFIIAKVFTYLFKMNVI